MQQAKVLSDLGYSESDIARTLKRTEKHMPPDADPATWVPSATDLSNDLLTTEGVQDAIDAWKRSRSVPRKYNQLLDAISEDD